MDLKNLFLNVTVQGYIKKNRQTVSKLNTYYIKNKINRMKRQP